MMQDASQHETPTTDQMPRSKRLYRSVRDRRIAGVCGGVAAYLGVDSFLIRILWVLACFVGFIGVVAYFAAWIIVPESPGGEPAPRAMKEPANRSYVLGIVLLVLGVILLADRQGFDFLVPWHWSYYVPHWLNWGVFFSVIIILGGIAVPH
jgi:phage shock protein PspC (stress-responsive transcriptional regulator)